MTRRRERCQMKFEKAVRQIENAEKKIDRVLRAARLERNPADTKARLEALIVIATIFSCTAAYIIFLLILSGRI